MRLARVMNLAGIESLCGSWTAEGLVFSLVNFGSGEKLSVKMKDFGDPHIL